MLLDSAHCLPSEDDIPRITERERERGEGRASDAESSAAKTASGTAASLVSRYGGHSGGYHVRPLLLYFCTVLLSFPSQLHTTWRDRSTLPHARKDAPFKLFFVFPNSTEQGPASVPFHPTQCMRCRRTLAVPLELTGHHVRRQAAQEKETMGTRWWSDDYALGQGDGNDRHAL